MVLSNLPLLLLSVPFVETTSLSTHKLTNILSFILHYILEALPVTLANTSTLRVKAAETERYHAVPSETTMQLFFGNKGLTYCSLGRVTCSPRTILQRKRAE